MWNSISVQNSFVLCFVTGKCKLVALGSKATSTE